MRLYDELGPLALARKTKCNKRSVYKRRQTLEKRYRRQITPPAHHAGPKTRHNIEHAAQNTREETHTTPPAPAPPGGTNAPPQHRARSTFALRLPERHGACRF